MREIEDFWADGNYGMRKLEADSKARQDAAREKLVDKFKEEEKERNRLAAYLWQMEFHPGKHHCGSCQGEYEDGYMGGGVMMDGWCCCRDNRMGRNEEKTGK